MEPTGIVATIPAHVPAKMPQVMGAPVVFVKEMTLLPKNGNAAALATISSEVLGRAVHGLGQFIVPLSIPQITRPAPLAILIGEQGAARSPTSWSVVIGTAVTTCSFWQE